jgi:hypothetical protein
LKLIFFLGEVNIRKGKGRGGSCQIEFFGEVKIKEGEGKGLPNWRALLLQILGLFVKLMYITE